MALMWLLFAISLGLGVSEWKSRSYDDLQTPLNEKDNNNNSSGRAMTHKTSTEA